MRLLLPLLIGLFSLRVLAQAIQYLAPQVWLPPFEQLQGSSLPYPLLLAAQLAILWLMFRLARRILAGRMKPERRPGVLLAILGGVYLTAALTRMAVGVALPTAAAWFRAWIPGAFHIVLAAFVLTLAAFHLSGSKAPE
jgi:hypothetical protein